MNRPEPDKSELAERCSLDDMSGIVFGPDTPKVGDDAGAEEIESDTQDDDALAKSWEFLDGAS